MYHIFFSHTSVDGHLGRFHFRIPVNIAAVNVYLQDSDSSQEGQSWVTDNHSCSFLRTSILNLVCYSVSEPSLKVKAMDDSGSG